MKEMLSWGFISQQLIFLVRIILAMLCGCIIGIERQQRIKVAGTRTHMMIAMAAALMMIISKYGFIDVIGRAGVSWDVSRVAASIITGIGILGGIIITGRQGRVSGTTTAAGLMATIAIGMAFGAGLYVMGVGVTALLLTMQYLLHQNLWIVRQTIRAQAVFHIEHGTGDYQKVLEELEKYEIHIQQFKWEKMGSESFQICCDVTIPARYTKEEIISIFAGMPETENFDIVYI
ncbi:MAG: Mg2+ transporter-C, MgtC family protein [Lachnospiraceae bacterium]|nr:Mg2+ transporter-C, MgtC family protein [Lachnospiraceae bacterium]